MSASQIVVRHMHGAGLTCEPSACAHIKPTKQMHGRGVPQGSEPPHDFVEKGPRKNNPVLYPLPDWQPGGKVPVLYPDKLSEALTSLPPICTFPRSHPALSLIIQPFERSVHCPDERRINHVSVDLLH